MQSMSLLPVGTNPRTLQPFPSCPNHAGVNHGAQTLGSSSWSCCDSWATVCPSLFSKGHQPESKNESNTVYLRTSCDLLVGQKWVKLDSRHENEGDDGHYGIWTFFESLNLELWQPKQTSSCPPYWSILASPPSSLLAKDPPSIVAKNVFGKGRHHNRGVLAELSRLYLNHNMARSAKQTTNMHQFNMTVGPAAMSELCGSFENLAVYLSFQCQSQLGDLLKFLSWPYNVAAMHIICEDFLYGSLLP